MLIMEHDFLFLFASQLTYTPKVHF